MDINIIASNLITGSIPIATPFPLAPIPPEAQNIANPFWDIDSWLLASSGFQTVWLIANQYHIIEATVIISLIVIIIRFFTRLANSAAEKV